jgi:predicted nucleotide-binding protein
MSSQRNLVPSRLQNEVLLKSRRRCAVCFGLAQDADAKLGQIAMLAASNATPSIDNLVYLCAEHHAQFDKGRLLSERIAAERDHLYQAIASEIEPIKDERTVFVVYGHNSEMAHRLLYFLSLLGLKTVRISDQPAFGRTMLDKFESANNVSCALVLLTADDRSASEGLRLRPRQNVVFELGYLIGRLGSNRVIVLCEPEIELPSDIRGISYISLGEKLQWQSRLASELIGLGLPVQLP